MDGKKNLKVIALVGLVIGLVSVILLCILSARVSEEEWTKLPGIYVTMFSIIMTLVPVGSYFVNKDTLKENKEDIKKENEAIKEALSKENKDLKEAFNKENEDLKATFEKETAELSKKIILADRRNAEFIESLVNRNDMDYKESDHYTKAQIDYINAESAYAKCEYTGCLNKVESSISNLSKVIENIEDENKEKFALLVYKVYNLYRHCAGRINRFADLKESIEDFSHSYYNKYKLKKGDIVNVVIVYTKVRSMLDEIEKVVKLPANRANFVSEISNKLDQISSDYKYVKLTMRARAYQIFGRYLSKDLKEKNTNYENAESEALSAFDEFQEMSSFKKDKDPEIKKALRLGCCFSVAKTLEQLSYVVDDKDLLGNAKKLMEKLIAYKRESKYFLEMSEILKSQGKDDESLESALYGYSLEPSDPLLAAQCAYGYLRKYLLSKAIFQERFSYLVKAEEYISNAYWVYKTEKENNKKENNKENHFINRKLLYIPSMYALIKAFVYIENKSDKLFNENELNAGIEECIDASLTQERDAENKNSAFNYTRAIITYLSVYNYLIDDDTQINDCEKKITHCKERIDKCSKDYPDRGNNEKVADSTADRIANVSKFIRAVHKAFEDLLVQYEEVDEIEIDGETYSLTEIYVNYI